MRGFSWHRLALPVVGCVGFVQPAVSHCMVTGHDPGRPPTAPRPRPPRIAASAVPAPGFRLSGPAAAISTPPASHHPGFLDWARSRAPWSLRAELGIAHLRGEGGGEPDPIVELLVRSWATGSMTAEMVQEAAQAVVAKYGERNVSSMVVCLPNS